jgi:uncharacterized protein YfcZ (UPF0381/DUF406 family)
MEEQALSSTSASADVHTLQQQYTLEKQQMVMQYQRVVAENQQLQQAREQMSQAGAQLQAQILTLQSTVQSATNERDRNARFTFSTGMHTRGCHWLPRQLV